MSNENDVPIMTVGVYSDDLVIHDRMKPVLAKVEELARAGYVVTVELKDQVWSVVGKSPR